MKFVVGIVYFVFKCSIDCVLLLYMVYFVEVFVVDGCCKMCVVVVLNVDFGIGKCFVDEGFDFLGGNWYLVFF